MKLTKYAGLFSILMICISCGSQLPDSYRMEKKYWNPEDYDTAIRHMKYSLNEEEGFPRLSDPLTAPVFNKLVDKQNVSIVLEDEQLGLKYRNEVAQDFFDATRELFKIYQVIDIQDKFVYPIELVQVIDFGLYTQILYFKTGNEAIRKDVVNPDDSNTKRVLQQNVQIVANNFNSYLEILAKEDAFIEAAKEEYAEVINTQFHNLITEFPSANFSIIRKTATLLIKKVDSPDIKRSLENLVDRIDEL